MSIDKEPGFSEPALRLPFRVRGAAGDVLVYCAGNEEPAFWGFDLLGLPFDIQTARGLPVVLARVRYAAAGYRAVMAWTQVVRVTPHDGSGAWTTLDAAPNGDGLPAFSYEPTLFDAPGPNPPRDNELWEAESYLLVCPTVARTQHVVPLLGFRWGYELRRGTIALLPITRLGQADWQRLLPLYRREWPKWQVETSFHQEPEWQAARDAHPPGRGVRKVDRGQKPGRLACARPSDRGAGRAAACTTFSAARGVAGSSLARGVWA